MQLDAALPIVRALADGVNPITGEAYPEQSPYAEPRTLRALYSAVDLMQKEVEREKRRERLPANFGKPWTAEEDQAAVAEFDAGIPMLEMARRHLRTQSSIRLRLEKLGKIEPTPAQSGGSPRRSPRTRGVGSAGAELPPPRKRGYHGPAKQVDNDKHGETT